MWNLNELITVTKQDIGIKDIPLPINDKDYKERIQLSALKEFSARFPRMENEFLINDNERISMPGDPWIKYRIPKYVYDGSQILAITKVDPMKPPGYSDYYVPAGMYVGADTVLSTIADIKMASAIASTLSKALTYRFNAPDILTIFNGWSGAVYSIDIALEHDISLSTIPPTAGPSFRELVKYDIMEYLWADLKRKNQLDLLIGNIDLKIEDWEGAADKKKDLLATWDENSSLDVDSIQYF